MLHEAIRTTIFSATQRCDIVSNGYNIVPALERFACVQTSPISFVATKEIGDVCTQAMERCVALKIVVANRPV